MHPLKWIGNAAKRMIGVAKRSITSLPWGAGGASSTQVGSAEALSLIPFFACVRLLSEQISALPLHAFRDTGGQPKQIYPQLLEDPAAIGTTTRWMRQMVVSLAMRGNAYGLVTRRDGFGFPTGIEWLHPDEVFLDDSRPTMPVFYWMGTRVPTENIFHVPWFVEPGRVKGLSPVSAFAAQIGVGLKTTDYGLSWFSHGGTPPGTFKNTQRTLTADQVEVVSQRLDAAIRRRRPIVYGADWDYNALQVSPEESQFIETMKLNATMIATIFGVPAELAGGESGGPLTYNNPEMNGMSLHKLTLRPWLVLIEDEISALLPEKQFVKFNPDGIIRADIKTRYAAHRTGLEAGFLTVNEVRKLEGLPPVEGGDTVRQPSLLRSPDEPRMTIDDLLIGQP